MTAGVWQHRFDSLQFLRVWSPNPGNRSFILNNVIPDKCVHCCYFMLSIWLQICCRHSVDTHHFFSRLYPKKCVNFHIIQIITSSPKNKGQWSLSFGSFLFFVCFFPVFWRLFLAWHPTRGDDGPALQKRVRMPFFLKEDDGRWLEDMYRNILRWSLITSVEWWRYNLRRDMENSAW